MSRLCLAGVFSPRIALQIVAARGQLMQATAPGAMLAVNLSQTALLSQLAAGCDLAAVNGNESRVLPAQTPLPMQLNAIFRAATSHTSTTG